VSGSSSSRSQCASCAFSGWTFFSWSFSGVAELGGLLVYSHTGLILKTQSKKKETEQEK